MSATEISCPQCATRLAFPPGTTATRCRCTACGTVFDVAQQQPLPAPAASPPPPPAPAPLPVPVPVPTPVFVLTDTQPGEEEEEELEEDRPARKKKRREAEEDEPRASTYRQAKGGNGGMIAILACVGALLLVGIAVGGYFAFREKPKPAAKNDPPPPAPPKPPAPKTPPLTPEQMIRKVKASTVYIRTFYRDGRLGTGSGFFSAKPGYVITNAHVIGYGPRDIRLPVRVEIVVDSGESTERVLPVTVYGLDVELDLAILRTDAPNLPPPLSLGKSEDLTETQEVVAFGYPFGEQLGKNVSVNRTTVSSLRKANGMVEVVQLAGGLNPGNSGGPIANAKGEVVGVSVAKLTGTDTIAFAIPAEVTDRFADDQLSRGGMVRLGDLAAFAPTELEGNYLLVGLEAKDVKLNEADLKQFKDEERKFVIRGDQLLANLKGKIDPATIKLDSSQKPAHIDIISSKGGMTEINYGIYKFENGILTICAVEKGEETERPTQFKAGNKVFLFVLRRLPPGN